MASGDAAEFPRPELDVDGQHQLDVGGADGFVEQLVDGDLPFQLTVLVFAHGSSLCGPRRQ